jgi:uncharacterized RDD family membrane protein YckC
MKTASVPRRLLAYLIDCSIVFLLFVIVLQFSIFIPLRSLIPNSDAWWRNGWITETYTLLTISIPTWLYFTLTEISPRRASLGKHLLRLQTLSISTNRGLTFFQSLVRTLIKLLPWELAHFTNNFPTPMWYTTNPGFRLGFAIIPVFVLVYLAMAQFTLHKQAPHDLATGSMVITK